LSSLARRIQIRALKRANKPRLPVLNETTGNVMTRLWPRRASQLAYFGNPPLPIFSDTQHPTLQPIIDILAENARRA